MKTLKSSNELVKIGTIFVGVSGYEQTNIDFYQVVSQHGKQTLGLRRIEKEQNYNPAMMQGYAKPIKNNFKSEIIKKRIKLIDGNIHIEICKYKIAKITSPDEKHFYSTYG